MDLWEWLSRKFSLVFENTEAENFESIPILASKFNAIVMKLSPAPFVNSKLCWLVKCATFQEIEQIEAFDRV